MSDPSSSDISDRQGLFDGFDAFITWSDSDYKSVLEHGLVTLDTNVLLDPYRWNVDSRSEFFRVLEHVKERLWIPNQVAVEFWHLRESVARHHREKADTAINSVRGSGQKITTVLNQWAKDVQAPDSGWPETLAEIGKLVDQLVQYIEDSTDDDAVNAAKQTTTDSVLNTLAQLLNGRVGAPPDQATYDQMVSTGKQRAEAGIPPGYKDADKEDAPPGDYILWEQMLREVAAHPCDVLLVTRDRKADWWHIDGQTRRPRSELVKEFRDRTRRRLYMLQPRDFMEIASRIFNLEVQAETLDDIQREVFIVESRKSGSPQSNSEFDVGWTQEAIDALLSRLNTEGPVQAAVIREAARANGFVPRAKVYELGEYEPGRMLRGFTRPVRRVTNLLQEDGFVPDTAVDVLSPVYDAGVQATGFSVPTGLIQFILRS